MSQLVKVFLIICMGWQSLAFAGVGRFPMRVKCATLSWHTLRAALDDEKKPIATVSLQTQTCAESHHQGLGIAKTKATIKSLSSKRAIHGI